MQKKRDKSRELVQEIRLIAEDTRGEAERQLLLKVARDYEQKAKAKVRKSI